MGLGGRGKAADGPKRSDGYREAEKRQRALSDALTASLVHPARQQHSTIVVEPSSDAPGVMVARSQPAIERMLRRGQLTMRQALAGQRIYGCWALGICGARDAEATGNGSDPSGYTDRQLDAATEYRKLREAVGLRLWPVVFGCCCDDLSPDRWANERGRGMDRKGAIALLRVALDIAADHLGLA